MWHFINLVLHPWYSILLLGWVYGQYISSLFTWVICVSEFPDILVSKSEFHFWRLFSCCWLLYPPIWTGTKRYCNLKFYITWLHYCWNEHLIKDLGHKQFLTVCDEITTLFLPLRVPGIELKSLDLVARAFIHWAISLASADFVQYVFRSFYVTKNDWPSELHSYFLKRKHQPWCQENWSWTTAWPSTVIRS